MAFLFSTCRTNFDQRTNRNFMVVPIPQHSLSIASNDYLQLRGAADFHAKGETRFRPERRKGKIEEGDKIPHLSSARGKSSILARSSTLCSVTKERRRRENARGKEKVKGERCCQRKRQQRFLIHPTPLEKLVKNLHPTRSYVLHVYAPMRAHPSIPAVDALFHRGGGGSVLPFNFYRLLSAFRSSLLSFETKRRKNDITPRKYRRRCAY